jgi:peptidoglycan/LPS O-acetylase OafA/YrhL
LTGLATFGLASYSLYLLHPVLIDAGARHLPAAPVPRLAAIVAIVGGVLVAAWLFYLVVERHFIGRGSRVRSTPPRRSPVTEPPTPT